MKQLKWIVVASSITIVGSWLLALYGCGGGGGPVKVTPAPEIPPSPTAEFLALLPEGQRGATFVGSEKCAECHGGKLAQVEPIYVSWSQTRHAKVNVGCEHCHGPGSKHSEAPREDNILTHPNITRSVICGQCHGPSYSDHKRSKHFKMVGLLTDPNFVGGNPRLYVAVCYRCHSSPFRVERVDSKLAVGKTRDEIDAAISALTNDQLMAYVPVSHETASCVTCHDPHRNTNYLTKEGKQAMLRSAIESTDTTDIAPGTLPKQHTTFNHICASCHNGRGANPSDSALETGTARPNMHESNQFNMLMGIGGVEGTGPVVRNMDHATAEGQCTHCHMPNGRHTMTVSYDVGCAPCHTPADAYRAQALREKVELDLYALRVRMENWARQQDFNDDGQPDNDPDLWDYWALVPDEKKSLSRTIQGRIPIQVKRARHNYYFVLRDASFGIHNPPYTRHLINVANLELDSIGVPRIAPETLLSRMPRQQIRAVLQSDLRRLKASAFLDR